MSTELLSAYDRWVLSQSMPAPAQAAVPEPEPIVATPEAVETTATADSSGDTPEREPATDTTEETVTDDEIIGTAVVYLNQGKSRPEINQCLLDEFTGIDNELDEIIDKAYERNIERLGQLLDEAQRVEGEAVDKKLEAEEEADRHLIEKVEAQGRLNKPVLEEDRKRVAEIIRKQIEKEQGEEEKFDHVETVFPEVPIFPGLLTDLARALYPSLPLEFKQWALITRWGLLRSGLDFLEHERHIQPRFYTILVSPPWRGKTACINESRQSMDEIMRLVQQNVGKKSNQHPHTFAFADIDSVPSVDSGQFLAQKFHEMSEDAHKRYVSGACLDDTAKLLLDPDELADVFEKARTSNQRNSTLFIEMLKLYGGNRTGSGTKKDGEFAVANAHLAVLAGTTVAKYPLLWAGTGGGADGLVSRFITITTNAEPVPPTPQPPNIQEMIRLHQWLAELAQVPGQTIRLDQGARDALNQWWDAVDKKNPNTTRILEFVKQVLIVLAVTNEPKPSGVITVGSELVKAATGFGDYEIAVRGLLNPGDSWSNIQAMENGIIDWMRKHSAPKNPKTRNDCRRGVNPHKKPGGIGAFLVAWSNCVNADFLKVRGQTQRVQLYSL